MVFRKQIDPQGDYIGQDGKRYFVSSCERTESMEYVQTGTDTQIIDGETVEVPVMEQQVVINKGWDHFDSIEAAAEAYGLAYDPIPEPELTAEEE